jgi:hypothetical protein
MDRYATVAADSAVYRAAHISIHDLDKYGAILLKCITEPGRSWRNETDET